ACYIVLAVLVEFFFSSRRRHTRSKRDWSSDVCSSDLDTDGKTTSYREDVTAQEFSARTDYCDVHIGKNYLTGDLKTYTLHFEKNGFVADLTIKNILSSWRPAAGANLFGDKQFSWLPAVPA